MTKFVIGPDVAIHLARSGTVPAAEHRLLAPTLIRSQLLSVLYGQVRDGELTKKDAEKLLDHVRALRLRLLGDRVLQGTAWRIAEQLGWADTFAAEYVALTQLQAEALITLDDDLADAVRGLVTVAPLDALG